MITHRRALLALLLAAAPAAASAQALPAEYGRITLDARTRFESYDQGALDAQALTVRARLGYQTPTFGKFTGLIEAEGVGVLVDDYADGVRPKPGRALITDPEILELNRAQVTWTGLPKAEVTLGRQRIILNNARFVGNVGWRQNEQTFDALRVVAKPTPKVSLTYAYVDRVNRSVGRDHPQGAWKGDVHLMQADVLTRAGAVSTYAYLLDFDNAATQSLATYGARLTGARPLKPGLSATWEAEYARQTDWGRNPGDFDLSYVMAAGGLKTATAAGAVVFERLDGDGRNGFQTPLATLHAFQGLSDVIGATPATGLRDIYLKGALSLPFRRPARLGGEAHDFRDADGAQRFGREFDLTVSSPLTKTVTLEAGVARFDTAGLVYPDATRSWVSLEYKY